MTKAEAKKIFDYHKINRSNFIGRRSIFSGFYYFEKSKVLIVEYISRITLWDNEKDRYICKANYSTHEFAKEEQEAIKEELSLF